MRELVDEENRQDKEKERKKRMKLKVVLIQTGMSSKSGKPYCRLMVRGKKADGSSVSAEFWLSEKVQKQLVQEAIEEDSWIQLEFDLDENLHPTVVGIYKDSEVDA